MRVGDVCEKARNRARGRGQGQEAGAGGGRDGCFALPFEPWDWSVEKIPWSCVASWGLCVGWRGRARALAEVQGDQLSGCQLPLCYAA